jgi:hypothetical protein
MASSIVLVKLSAIQLALLIAAQVCVASGPSPPPPLLLRAPTQGSTHTNGSREGAQAVGKGSNTTTAAALKVAGASLIVSVRLTDCDWPPGRSLERAAAIAAAAAAATSTATGPISNSSSSSSTPLQGTSPMARAQVLCVYDESARRRPYQHQLPQQGRGGGVRPADVPGTVTVAGVPLAHCALGAPLGLRYLLALRRGALPGAPLRLISSTPLVGDARSVSRQLDGAVAERFCLVDPKPRRSWRRDWRRRRRSRSLLQQQAEEGGGAGQQQQQQEVCGLPPDAGPCGGSLRRWFYDSPRGVCRRFAYSGCGGNANNFATAAACAAACPSE